jgi:DNA topoisomerase-2
MHNYMPDYMLSGFIQQFITPIMKCTKGKRGREEKTFFTIAEYESWKEDNNNAKGWEVWYGVE